MPKRRPVTIRDRNGAWVQVCDTHGDLKLFSKPCVRRYAHCLKFAKYSAPGGFSEPLSTLQLDIDVSPDRLRNSLHINTQAQDNADGPSTPDPVPGNTSLPTALYDPPAHSQLPAYPLPDLTPERKSTVSNIPVPEPPPSAAHISERKQLSLDAQTNKMNAA